MTPTPTPVPTPSNPVAFSFDLVAGIGLLLLLIIGIVVIIFLYRNGWRWRDIKRMKLGGVEFERGASGETSSPSGGDKSSQASAEIKKSKFKGSVGDIGGVIVKGQNPNLEAANESETTVSVERSEFESDVGDIGGKIIKDDSPASKDDDKPQQG